MKLNFTLLIVFQLFCIFSSAQDIESIEIKYDDKRCFGYESGFVENSDTATNLYLLFESQFFNEYVEVQKNDSTVFSGKISTGPVMAKLVKLGNVCLVKEFALKIGESPIIKLPVFEKMCYIRIGLSRPAGRLVICYSHKMPVLF